MPRKKVSKDAIRRTAIRSAQASTELERRAVPKGHVRSEKAGKFIAERRKSA